MTQRREYCLAALVAAGWLAWASAAVWVGRW